MEIKKYTGSAVFICGILTKIKSSHIIINTTIDRAILRGNELVFDIVECDEQASGLIKLYSNDKFSFYGTFTYTDDTKPSAEVKVTWYENNNAVLLKGIWKESPDEWTVIIHLKAVENFESNII